MTTYTDELLSTAEAAELLNRDRSTVTRWVQSGRLPVHHRTPGGTLLFLRSEVETLLAEAAS